MALFIIGQMMGCYTIGKVRASKDTFISMVSTLQKQVKESLVMDSVELEKRHLVLQVQRLHHQVTLLWDLLVQIKLWRKRKPLVEVGLIAADNTKWCDLSSHLKTRIQGNTAGW